MSSPKVTVLFGSSSVAAGQTLGEPVASQTTGSPTWSSAKVDNSKMDVLLNVKTESGSNPGYTYSIQERFSDVGFVETARSSMIGAVGQYLLCNDGQTGQTNTSSILYGFAMLGKGSDKQVVITNRGSVVGAISTDIYLIFHD